MCPPVGKLWWTPWICYDKVEIAKAQITNKTRYYKGGTINKLNIGIFTDVYHPTINGVVRSVDTFKKTLEKKGHKFFIFAPSQNGALQENRVWRIPSLPLPGQNDYRLALPVFSNFNFLPQLLKLNIIHLQHIFRMGSLGLKLGRGLKIPVVLTYHTMLVDYTNHIPIIRSSKFLKKLAKNYLIRRSRRLANRCQLVIVPSKPILQELRSYGVKTRIEILPTGVDLKRFKTGKMKLPPKSLVYVGRLSEEKNLKMLFLAFALVLKKVPEARLFLVGDGPSRKDYENLAQKLGLAKQVSFTGFLDQNKTTQYQAAADLFVFPSVTDTQGLVVVEAMAAQTPVVVVGKLGPGEIVKHGIFGFKTKNNPRDFADKIIKLLFNEKLRLKMGKADLMEAKNYAQEKMAVKMEKIYYSLLK